MKDPLGNVSKICYNAFNLSVTTTDANGIVTKYAYNDAGLVTRRSASTGARRSRRWVSPTTRQVVSFVKATKELADDPSLLNAVAELVLTFGSKLKGRGGQVIGRVADGKSVLDAASEIIESIQKYGEDTIWDVEFGTETFAAERRRPWEFRYVNA